MESATMFSSTMPPAVPHRNPERLTLTATSDDLPLKYGMTSEQSEQWERAVLLNHTLDFSGAADIFLHLSKTIRSDLESTLCLLNAGIIHYRLGHFKLASEILDQAARVDETLALTLFAMGNAEFQLGNIAKAKDCWQIAANTLDEQPAHYSPFGFDFELTPQAVEHNLNLLWTRQSHPEKIARLATLPPNDVFEAPYRTPASEAGSGFSKGKASSSSSRRSVELNITALPYRTTPTAPQDDAAATLFPVKSIEYARESVVLHPPLARPGVKRLSVVNPKARASSSSTFGNLMKQWQAHRRQSSALRYGDFNFRQEVEKECNAKQPNVPATTIPPVPALPHRKLNPMSAHFEETPRVPIIVTRPPPGPGVARPPPPPSPRSFAHAPMSPVKLSQPPPLSGHVEVVSPQEIADFFRRTRGAIPVDQRMPPPRHANPSPRVAPPPTSPKNNVLIDDDASVYSNDEDSSRHDSMVSDEAPKSQPLTPATPVHLEQPSTPRTPTMPSLPAMPSMSPTSDRAHYNQEYSRPSASSSFQPAAHRPQTSEIPSSPIDLYDISTYYSTAPLYPEPTSPLPPLPMRSASRRKVVPMLPQIQELDTYTPGPHPAMRHPVVPYYTAGGMF